MVLFKKKYPLRKCKKILIQSYKLYKKSISRLDSKDLSYAKKALETLQEAIIAKNKEKAKEQAIIVERLQTTILKQPPIRKFLHSAITLSIAIIIAICIRQMWFENYAIPSGSMRPTLKEKDFLIVSKTTFGINKPLMPGHFYYNNNLIKRGDIVTFTTADMDVKDSDYMYFYIIPGKKQFVKRIVGKPGDTIYFYGGDLYGIDKNGNEIKEYRNNKWFQNIKHIPFIRFEGNENIETKNSYGIGNVILSQMNTPIAKLSSSYTGPNGSLLTNNKVPFGSDFKAKNYFDVWGFKNYAMARILSKKQAQEFNLISANQNSKNNNYDYYLELTHHPDIKKLTLKKDYLGRIIPSLTYSKSIIPLDSDIINKIHQSLYTCRFKVNNGHFFKVGYGYKDQISPYTPILKNIPNGTYEFQDGIAYSVNFTGITKKLPKTHPIYKKSLENIAFFYNLGIEMHTLFSPKEKNQYLMPSRYAYFNNGDFLTMGHVIINKNNPILLQYIEKENSAKTNGYPFIDTPPPISDGKINKDYLFSYGLTVPENHYLVLGDNHAMSADSRDFGFVPQGNIKGKPLLIFWPTQNRFGALLQPSHSIFSFPNIFINLLGIFIVICCYLYYKRKYKLPLKF